MSNVGEASAGIAWLGEDVVEMKVMWPMRLAGRFRSGCSIFTWSMSKFTRQIFSVESLQCTHVMKVPRRTLWRCGGRGRLAQGDSEVQGSTRVHPHFG